MNSPVGSHAGRALHRTGAARTAEATAARTVAGVAPSAAAAEPTESVLSTWAISRSPWEGGIRTSWSCPRGAWDQGRLLPEAIVAAPRPGGTHLEHRRILRRLHLLNRGPSPNSTVRAILATDATGLCAGMCWVRGSRAPAKSNSQCTLTSRADDSYHTHKGESCEHAGVRRAYNTTGRVYGK